MYNIKLSDDITITLSGDKNTPLNLILDNPVIGIIDIYKPIKIDNADNKDAEIVDDAA